MYKLFSPPATARDCATICVEAVEGLKKDVNVAANILPVGLSDRPPQPFRRSAKRTREEDGHTPQHLHSPIYLFRQ